MMKHFNALTCATLAILAATGCGAADDVGSLENAQPTDPSTSQAEAAEGVEIARVELIDGNVVRFEELEGGILISEIGHELNARHTASHAGLTAVEMFKALAPERAVPEALTRVHERMYPPARLLAPHTGTAAGATPGAEELEVDPDLEHNGEFQQSYPAANFMRVMCDFPLTSPSYKHSNRTDAHADVSMSIRTAYYAVGSDIGTIRARACAGKDAGGYFDGKCSAWSPVNAGYHASAYYDAGLHCTSDSWGYQVCAPRKVRFQLEYSKISSNVRFHECAKLTR